MGRKGIKSGVGLNEQREGAHGDGRGMKVYSGELVGGRGGGDWTKRIWEVKEDGKRGGIKR